MNVEVVHVGIPHFDIQNSLIDIRYFKKNKNQDLTSFKSVHVTLIEKLQKKWGVLETLTLRSLLP
jgi:hypothetical protein